MTEQASFPLIDDLAPKFTAQTSHGVINFPEDYEGKWVILFSHPADFTPVCTTEFVAFAKRFDQFQNLNTELLGLSIDQVFSHIKWKDWIKDNLDVEIPFPIIADHGDVAKKYGMIHSGGSNTVRAVFVIDPKSKIRSIIYYPASLGRNFDELERIIKALQYSDEHKVAMPADWPNNTSLGLKDRVIIPPASDVKAAKERLALAEKDPDVECYDWWLCHKKA